MISVIYYINNNEQSLNNVYDCLLAQTYKNIELILIDDVFPNTKGIEVENWLSKHKILKNNPVKYYRNDKNIGFINSCINAVKLAEGEYISFLNDNDSISVDFYRTLIGKAIETNSDVVGAQFLYFKPDKTYRKIDSSLFCSKALEVNRSEAYNIFKQNVSLDLNFQLLFNKIYKKSLLLKIAKYIDSDVISMENGDTYISLLIFDNLNKFATVNTGAWYLYNCTAHQQFSPLKITTDCIRSNVQQIKKSFDSIYKYLYKTNKANDIGIFRESYNFIVKCWQNKAHVLKNKSLEKEIEGYFDKQARLPLDSEIDFYDLTIDNDYINTERLEKHIIDSDVVSFDVFDTLILRPFLDPTDIFQILEFEYNEHFINNYYVRLKEYRETAEKLAREFVNAKKLGYEEISLYEIYDQLQSLMDLNNERKNWILNKEIELEYKYCTRRNFAYRLFDLAKYLGKKVVVVSDMYLPKEVIANILNKSGFNGCDDIFVSSDYRVCKWSSKLFNIVREKYHNLSVAHFGDNPVSDVNCANSAGIKGLLLPKPVDVMNGICPSNYGGEFFNRIKHTRQGTFIDAFFANRCIYGLIANKLYDNPFVNFREDSDFNGNPYRIGYFVMGPFLLGISLFLEEVAKNSDQIVFMGRDGYLVKLAFEFRNKNKKITSYFYSSRKAMLPLFVKDRDDFNSLQINVNLRSLTPEKLIKMLRPLSNYDVDTAIEIAKRAGYLINNKFEKFEIVQNFLNFYKNNLFDEQVANQFHRDFYNYIKNIFVGKTITSFDLGYSCRTEALFERNYGLKISPVYLYCLNNQAYFRNYFLNLGLKTYFDSIPTKQPGFLSEELFRENGPSCISYYQDGKIQPQFEKYFCTRIHTNMINLLHSGALEFVQDFSNSFDRKLDYIFRRYEDLALPFILFNDSAKPYDRRFFANSFFEDDLGVGTLSLLDTWNSLIPFNKDEFNNKNQKGILIVSTFRFLKNKIFNLNKNKNNVYSSNDVFNIFSYRKYKLLRYFSEKYKNKYKKYQDMLKNHDVSLRL